MLQLRIKPSRWDLLITLASHGGALFALALVPIPPLSVLAGALLICVSGGYLLWHWHPAHPGHVRRLDIATEHCVVTTSGDRVTTNLPEPRYISEWLIILHCPPVPEKGAGLARRRDKPLVITLYPDSLAPEADRQLRRYLRFDCPAVTRVG